MAIALTDFEAFFKFKSYEKIAEVMNSTPALVEAIGKEHCDRFLSAKQEEREDELRNILK